MIDVTPNYISMIEKGRRNLSEKKAQKLADAFAPMRYQYLLCYDDFKTTSDKTLWNMALEVESKNSLLLGIKSIANNNDYWITNPSSFFGKAKEFGVQMPIEELQRIPYIIKHNDQLLLLSEKKMNSLCKLISDFVRVQFEYLFDTENLLNSNNNRSNNTICREENSNG